LLQGLGTRGGALENGGGIAGGGSEGQRRRTKGKSGTKNTSFQGGISRGGGKWGRLQIFTSAPEEYRERKGANFKNKGFLLHEGNLEASLGPRFPRRNYRENEDKKQKIGTV